MAKLRHVQVVGVALLATIAGYSQSQPPSRSKLYFLNHDELWCVYSTESRWKAAATAGDSVGTVEFVNMSISRIFLTTPDDPGAGDWVAFDKYSLDSSGRLRSLERTINVLPGRLSQLEVWEIRPGSALRQRSLTRDLETLQVKEIGDWVPDLPVFTDVKAMPVWPLLAGQPKRGIAAGKACLTVKRPLPTPPPAPEPVTSWSTYVDQRFGWSVQYPSTWIVNNSCPIGCSAPGDSVSFQDQSTGEVVLISSLTDPAAGRNAEDRLAQLKHTNVNPQIGETRLELNGLSALTARYVQPETQMESTYVVTEAAHFQIGFTSLHWKIEQMTDYHAYQHILRSFKLVNRR